MKSRERPPRTHNLRQNNSYFLFCQAFFSKIQKNYALNQNRFLPASLHTCNALPVTRGLPISGDEKSGVNSMLFHSQLWQKNPNNTLIFRFTLNLSLFCHCEHSEAISLLRRILRDCFVANAPRKDMISLPITKKTKSLSGWIQEGNPLPGF